METEAEEECTKEYVENRENLDVHSNRYEWEFSQSCRQKESLDSSTFLSAVTPVSIASTLAR